jgi:broad-specificity NMP kinase
VPIAGKIVSDGINWIKNEPYFGSRVMIIMRGLPGSGKSSLSQTISNKNGYEICSADKYFVTKNGYQFDKEKLDAAHRFCYDEAKDNIKNNKSIIMTTSNFKGM